MGDESDELLALRAAVQAMANECEGRPVIVTSAVVVWETTSYDDDGEDVAGISYSVPSNSASISATLGLLDACRYMVRRDTLARDEDEPDE
jgi:hypothetical protein